MPGRLLALLIVLTVCGTAHAACVAEAFDYTLELAGVGTIYYGNLSYDKARDVAELYDGVCFQAEAEPGLTLRAGTMRVTEVETAPAFSAKGATLTVDNYAVFTETLSGDATGLGLQDLSVVGDDFSGTAVRARYTFETGQTILSRIDLQLGSFRVAGRAAGLTDDTLVLRTVRATTCDCPGGGLYELASPEVTIDLRSGVVRVEGGTLETLGLGFGLDPELRLLLDGARPQPGARRARVRVGNAALLPAPPAPEPIGPLEEGGRAVLPLQVAPWAGLELGVAGFDEHYPLGLVALARLRSGNLRAVLGRAGPGFRADALLRTPLAPGVGLDVSTANRFWERAGYLHEGAVSLYAGRRLTSLLGELNDSLNLSAQVFAALSQQTLLGLPVGSARLGGRASTTYTGPPTSVGTLGLRVETQGTFYPRGAGGLDDLTQFGVQLTPSWRGAFGPLRASLGYDQQFVWGGSPFSTSLDRLEPRSVVDASVNLNTPVTATVGPGSLGFTGRYAFVLTGAQNPVRSLRFDASLPVPAPGVRFENTLSLELAGLLGPADPEVEAFLAAETEVMLPGSPLELGFRGRYAFAPGDLGLELLEVYAGYPVTLPGVTVEPFVGLNAAPLLNPQPLPFVTGYGLSVALTTCCGTLIGSYRFHDETVSTSFDIRLGRVRERQP